MSFDLNELDRCGHDADECQKHMVWNIEDITKLSCSKCGLVWEMSYDHVVLGTDSKVRAINSRPSE